MQVKFKENVHGDASRLEDGDEFILKGYQDVLFHRCCGCDLWHKVEINRYEDNDIGMEWYNLGHDTPEELSDVSALETHIIKKNGAEWVVSSDGKAIKGQDDDHNSSVLTKSVMEISSDINNVISPTDLQFIEEYDIESNPAIRR